MSAVGAGVVEVDSVFASIIDFCLGCRACEPVCPGLVPYGRALEGTRAEISAQIPGRDRRRRWLLGTALGSRAIMRLVGIGTILAQAGGLTRLVPGRYRRVTRGLRSLRRRGESTVGTVTGSGDSGIAGLLAGCVQDEWFRPVNLAAVRLLALAGYRVTVPERQTCCGALAAHDGKAKAATRYEERNVDAFGGADVLVATAAGCSAHLAGYRWPGHSPRVMDVTVTVAEAIQDGRLPRSSRSRGEIAIQDPCHLRHAQRVIAEPRIILESAGYTVVEIDEVALCCGAAGIYTVLQPEASEQLGNQKADQIRSVGVTRVASANPGCEMQLRSHLGEEYEIRHPIEWYLDALTEEALV
jgi:glycolate oxidase iron-sulfur subunit